MEIEVVKVGENVNVLVRPTMLMAEIRHRPKEKFVRLAVYLGII